MFIIDDILLSPIKGLLALSKKIQEIAEEEAGDSRENLKKELSDIQFLFETDQITEEEYYKREKNILERLNVLQKEK